MLQLQESACGTETDIETYRRVPYPAVDPDFDHLLREFRRRLS
jgi:hypothetical protein